MEVPARWWWSFMRGGRSEEGAAEEGLVMLRIKWEKVGRGTDTGNDVVLNLLEGGVFTSDNGDGPMPPPPPAPPPFPCPGYCGVEMLDWMKEGSVWEGEWERGEEEKGAG